MGNDFSQICRYETLYHIKNNYPYYFNKNKIIEGMKIAFACRNEDIIIYFINKEPILFEENRMELILCFIKNSLSDNNNLYELFFIKNFDFIQWFINSIKNFRYNFLYCFIDYLIDLNFIIKLNVDKLFKYCHKCGFVLLCKKLLNDRFELTKDNTVNIFINEIINSDVGVNNMLFNKDISIDFSHINETIKLFILNNETSFCYRLNGNFNVENIKFHLEEYYLKNPKNRVKYEIKTYDGMVMIIKFSW